MSANTVTKELTRGVLLHKKQIASQSTNDGTEFIYIFKIEVKSF